MTTDAARPSQTGFNPVKGDQTGGSWLPWLSLLPGLLLRSLLLPLAVAFFWRSVTPFNPFRWPQGLATLFETDLPLVLAILGLSRVAAYFGRRPSPGLLVAEKQVARIFLLPMLLVLLRSRPQAMIFWTKALFGGLVLAWVGVTLVGVWRVLEIEIRPRWSGTLALFLCFLGLYAAVGRYTCHLWAPTADEPHYLVVAHSLWQDGDLDLSDDFRDKEYLVFYPGPLGPRSWDVTREDGKIYSWGGPLFPALLTIPYGIGGRSGVVLFLNLVAAMTMLGVYRLARDLGGKMRESLVGCLFFGMSLPVVAYSSLVYPELLASGLLVAAARLLVPFLEESEPSREERQTPEEYTLSDLLRQPMGQGWRLGLGATILAFLSVLRAKYLALALPMGLLCTWRAGGKRAVRVSVGITGLLGMYAFVDLGLMNGEWIGRLAGYLGSAVEQISAGGSLAGLVGIWFDQEWGLLLYNPLLLAGLAGLFLAALVPRKRVAAHGAEPGRESLWTPSWTARGLAVVVLLYSVAVGLCPIWFGDWSSPGRFLVPLVPLMAVGWGVAGIGEKWSESRWGPFLVFGAAQAGLFTIVLLFSPPLGYNYADGTAAILEEAELVLRMPICRFFPSQIRPGGPESWLVPGVIALFTVLLAFRRRPRNWRWVLERGVLLALVPWILPVLGQSLFPTNVIEVEDSLVRSIGAEPWPASRTFYSRSQAGDLRLGLRLPPKTALATEIIAGPGKLQVLVFGAATKRGTRLRLFLDGEPKATCSVPAGGWGPYGLYALKKGGPMKIQIRNLGPGEMLIDKLEIR